METSSPILYRIELDVCETIVCRRISNDFFSSRFIRILFGLKRFYRGYGPTVIKTGLNNGVRFFFKAD